MIPFSRSPYLRLTSSAYISCLPIINVSKLKNDKGRQWPKFWPFSSWKCKNHAQSDEGLRFQGFYFYLNSKFFLFIVPRDWQIKNLPKLSNFKIWRFLFGWFVSADKFSIKLFFSTVSQTFLSTPLTPCEINSFKLKYIGFINYVYEHSVLIYTVDGFWRQITANFETVNNEVALYGKALRNWKIFLKAFSKRLRKLTIKTKRLWRNAGPYCMV